ncbi:MAG: hypothetical protein APF76_11500 [Desulfitibacter sp. BRH_c19]|nr:MAG: hypothetical protein APF76_11500 [Desulfitibacter sp. BRH_c19]
MYKLPIISAVLQGIPESTALVFLSMVLLKAKFNWKTVLLLGIIQTTGALFIRLLPFAFGVHTVLLMLFLSFIISYAIKYDMIKVIPAALGSGIFLIVYEFIAFKFLMYQFNISLETVIESPILRIAIATPQTILLFLTGFIILFMRRHKTK